MKKNKEQIDNSERRVMVPAQEIRAVSPPEDRTDATPTIEGYAYLYNSPSKSAYWCSKEQRMKEYIEVIMPGAGVGVLERSDVRALLNHNEDMLLARSKFGQGTLQLSIDERGLQYSFACPRSRMDVAEMLERGDLDQCSFRFIVSDETWRVDEDGVDVREIRQFEELFDVTLATFPFYPDTTVALRSKEGAQQEMRAVDTELVEIERQRIECDLRLREMRL